jgi:hypothetical protein
VSERIDEIIDAKNDAITDVWQVQSNFIHVLRLTTQKNHVWVFGMQWYTLISAQSRRNILLDQRRKKATHYAELTPYQNSTGSVFGVTSLLPKSIHKNEKVHAAALVFARQHLHDTHILILHVSEQSWWMVASHHGAVVCQTDIWYTDRFQVDEHVQQLKTRFISVSIKEVNWKKYLVEWAAEPDQSKHALFDVTDPAVQAQILLPISNSPLFKVVVFSGIFFVLAAIVLTYLWINHKNNRLNHSHLTSHQLEGPAQASSLYQSHSHESISAMVVLWHALPLDPSGWLLKRVECERQNDAFRCQAHYKRNQPHANNGQLARAIPVDWQLVPQSLDQVSLVRDISITAQPINWSEQSFTEDWLTPLQQRQAIFQSLQLGAGEEIPMSLTHTARPIYKRPIRLSGPLRSLPALSGLKQPIQWQYASLEIVDQTILDLTHSHFVLHLVGDIFVPS